MTLFAAAALVLLPLATAALALVRVHWPLTAPAPALRRPDPAARWRAGGILVGAAGAAVALRVPDLGRGVLLAAPVFGLGVFAGALAGELTRRRPAGPVRRAALRVRRSTDYLPRALSTVVALSIVALAALATATTLTGAPDDRGRPGRALACAVSTYGPWPGSYYTAPALSAVLAGLILAGFTLRRVVRRPQAAELAATDDAARRRSAEVITAATGILTLVPLTGIALSAGLVLGVAGGTCEARWWDGAGPPLSALGLLAFAAAAWCGACLLLPAKVARR
jgi:hypothetical protein